MQKKRLTNITTVVVPKKNRKEVRFNFDEESDKDGSGNSCNSPTSPDIDKNDPKTFFNQYFEGIQPIPIPNKK